MLFAPGSANGLHTLRVAEKLGALRKRHRLILFTRKSLDSVSVEISLDAPVKGN